MPLRLQSFCARAEPEPLSADSGPGYAGAFQEGYEQGLNHGREASLDELSAELGRLNLALASADAEAARIRQDLLNDLKPVILGLVDLLGKSGNSQRLIEAVDAELRRFVDTDAKGSLRIRCPHDMHDDIRDCINRAGVENAEIVATAADGVCAEIRTGHGRTTLDPGLMLDELRNVIEDIFREE